MPSTVTVLHVDDDPTFLETTATVLEREDEGLSVESEARAREALDRLPGKVDCIVSDYEMPGMDGIEFLEAVREDFEDLPFILFTGKGSEAVASEAISAGVTDYLQKGSKIEQYTLLANRIRNAVESARAKTAARRSQERLSNLAEAYPDVAFYIDEDGLYFDILAGRESPLLYNHPEDLVGERIADLFPPETAERFGGVVRRALETGEKQTIQYELDVRAGPRWFEARVAPLTTDAVDRRAVIWVARDITNHKDRERALEQRVERLETFVGLVGEDLAETLADVDVILDKEVDDADRTADAGQALDRSKTLVDDLSTVAADDGQVGEIEPVAIDEVVEAAWTETTVRDATLVTNVAGSIRANRNALSRLFGNLFRNAVEHAATDDRTPGSDVAEIGDADVTVTVGRLDDGFYVADDGPGIPEDERERVFEAGYSADGGPGVGLTVVREIAAAHGWTIRVTESDNDGARVEISGVGFC